jgi:hypothetical protein
MTAPRLDSWVPVAPDLCFHIHIPGGVELTRRHFELFREYLGLVERAVVAEESPRPEPADPSDPPEPPR